MLKAFVDDSAGREGEERLYLAGYINHENAWVAFDKRWRRALQRDPPISYFRMADAEHLSDQFLGWTRPQRDRKIESMADIIRRNCPISIEVSLSKRDFSEVFLPVAPYGFRHAYFLAFSTLVVKAAEWQLVSGSAAPVHVVFDQQGSIGAEAAMWYQEIRKSQSAEVQSCMGIAPQFCNDRDTAALQAADMLVWHLRRANEARFAHEHRPVLDMLRGRQHIEVRIERAILASMAQKMAALPGIHLVQSRKSWRSMKPELKKRLSLGLGPPQSGDDLVIKRSPRQRPSALRIAIRRFLRRVKLLF